MKHGYLKDYVTGVAGKRLSAAETDPHSSNQHEFNGVDSLVAVLGEPAGKQKYETRFVYLNDTLEVAIDDVGFLTWYDARQKAREERNVMRWERRMYYSVNAALDRATAGDGLLIALLPNRTLLCIIVAGHSTTEAQLLWLFGLPSLDERMKVVPNLDEQPRELTYSVINLLESLGIDVSPPDDNELEKLLAMNGGKFPSTQQLSEFARRIAEANPLDDPDGALLAWYDTEHRLFRLMEYHDVSARLRGGFMNTDSSVDVDGFLHFSLSVQNRRKARAGQALENHFAAILDAWGIRYSRTPTTEGRNRPDFIIPGIDAYHEPTFPADKLTMVACKSSCKDRWRQILTEANRIWPKHLLTLDAAVSQNQMEEMEQAGVVLVRVGAAPRPVRRLVLTLRA